MRNSTKNAIAAVVAIVLAVAIVIACGVGSSWFTNSDIATWFNSWGKGEQTEQPDKETPDDEQPVDEGGIVVGESQGAISLMSSVATVTTAAGETRVAGQTVTVQNPEDAVTYTWSLSMSGGSASDYVTLSATTGTSVTVTPKAAFGTPITLTCTATFDGETLSTATVKLDYKKRISGISLNGVTVQDGGSYELDEFYSGSKSFADIMKTDGFIFDYDPVMGVGTVSPDSSGYLPMLEVTASGDNLVDPQTFQQAGDVDFNEVYFGVLSGNVAYKEQFANGTIDPFIGAFIASQSKDITWTVKLGVSFSKDGSEFTETVTFTLKFPTEWAVFNYDVSLDKTGIVF
ncbi:MAG TPA: hypothetical protein IAB64_01430 [Candidatus Coproplasma excrementavium]|nr:hypothetical protein [Candidatus Coproplasma excrementavium]